MGCQFAQGHYFGAAMPFSETLLRLTVGDTMQAIERMKQTNAA
jgi:EAL domain-containing protein (putative c-di-GMP-specific phosphodiesterase class I)